MKIIKRISALLVLSSTFLGGCNFENFANFLDDLTDPAHITGEDQTQEGQGEEGQGEGEQGQGQEQEGDVLVSSISLGRISTAIKVGESKTISYSVSPSNATNKEVKIEIADPSVASYTLGNSNAITIKGLKAGETSITVTAKDGSGVSASRTFSVTGSSQTDPVDPVDPQPEEEATDYSATILIYMCGSDLESGYANQTYINDGWESYEWNGQGLAAMDIMEILSVKNKPNDINIVIQTGGANSWTKTTYANYGNTNIDPSKLQRWHVENQKLVLDQSLSYASMGLSSTLQSFVEYGLNTYPADKTGLILWNHGGGITGVCFDERKSSDSLLASEVHTAVGYALGNAGKAGQKLEWIGYDACLMSLQDIAIKNSDYFNYMVAAQESESGTGWDYDNWLDDLYAKKSTKTVLKAICDSFIEDNNTDDYGNYSTQYNDQTLAYLDLRYATTYKTAWENFASQLKSKFTSSNKSSFASLVKSAKYYADSDYGYFGMFDVKDFISKLQKNSTFKVDSSYTDAVLDAHTKLVGYSKIGAKAGNSNGLCMYWCVNSDGADVLSSCYTKSETPLTTWQSLAQTYGYTGSSSGGGHKIA